MFERGKYLMAIASKLIMIGIVAISVLAGLISFYLMTDSPKDVKKKQIEEFISLFINFVLFIWLGKIIANWKIFISDPLAVLAYPSDSDAFYLAVLFSVTVLVYKSKYKKINVKEFFDSFIHVFLIASFVYEFIQLVWKNNPFSLSYLVLFTVLLILYFLLRERMTTTTLIIVILVGWTCGMIGISLYHPYITMFDYMIAPWFVGAFLLIGITIIIIKDRKRDK
jgi:hypothetical protein